MIRFTRAHGLGNDYVILSDITPPLTLSSQAITLLCDRHQGIGSDGILLPAPSDYPTFGLRIFNPDGSEAEKSGNGLRIFARFLFDQGSLKNVTSISTAGGEVEASVQLQESGPPLFKVDMGPVSFNPLTLPLTPPHPPTSVLRLEVEGVKVTGTALSIGNPHFVLLNPDLGLEAFLRLAPAIECHPSFPHRTNVQRAIAVSRKAITLDVWERGAGHTLASGSSACAAVAAGIHHGLLDTEVSVHMKGGVLQVSQDSRGHIHQQGPVTVIAHGVVAEDLEAEVRRLCTT